MSEDTWNDTSTSSGSRVARYLDSPYSRLGDRMDRYGVYSRQIGEDPSHGLDRTTDISRNVDGRPSSANSGANEIRFTSDSRYAKVPADERRAYPARNDQPYGYHPYEGRPPREVDEYRERRRLPPVRSEARYYTTGEGSQGQYPRVETWQSHDGRKYDSVVYQDDRQSVRSVARSDRSGRSGADIDRSEGSKKNLISRLRSKWAKGSGR